MITKEKIIAEIAEKNDISKSKAEKIFNDVFDIIKDNVEKGEKVRIFKFGSFESVKRAEREGYNLSTKEKFTIPAYESVKFSVSKNFKKLLND